MIGIHLRIMSSVFTNANDYAKECSKAPNIDNFRDDPSISELGDAMYKNVMDKRNAG